MVINNSLNSVNVRPEKPAEPLAPPGGNIENRQPPPEPLPPIKVNTDSKVENKSIISDNQIDVYI